MKNESNLCKAPYHNCENERGIKINICEKCELIDEKLKKIANDYYFHWVNTKKSLVIVSKSEDIDYTTLKVEELISSGSIIVDTFFVFKTEQDREKWEMGIRFLNHN